MKIKLDDVTKKIHGNIVLDSVSLEFKSGKIYGIRGTNGSGKTMLMRAICGFIRITEGTVTIDGKKLGEDMEFPDDVGVLIEHPGLIENYTGFKNMRTLADVKKVTSDDEIRQLLTEVNLDPDNPKKVKKYSLGMKQKLGIAEAFLDNPDLLLLDEPFNALDEKTAEKIRNMIKRYINKDRIIIISCHNDVVLNELCDEVYNIEEGRIIQ